MPQHLMIGTYGFEHDAWRGDFYPEELPPEWRFCFFSNRIRSVLLPSATWLSASGDDVRQWVEDCDPEFRFVLELPAALAQPLPSALARSGLTDFLAMVQPIAAQTAGLLLRVPPAAPVDLAWLERFLPMLQEYKPACVDLPLASRSAATLATLAALDVSLCWRPDSEPQPAAGGRLLIALLAQADPRALRRVLESLSAWAGDARTAGLFFEAPHSAIAQAEQARTLAELMGL